MAPQFRPEYWGTFPAPWVRCCPHPAKSAQLQYSGHQVDFPVPPVDHGAEASQSPCHSLCCHFTLSHDLQLRVVALLTACALVASLVTAITRHQQMSLCLSPGIIPCFLLLETTCYMVSVSANQSCHGRTHRPSTARAVLGAIGAPDSLLHSLSLSPGTGHRF